MVAPLLAGAWGRQGWSGSGSWPNTESSPDEQVLLESGHVGEYCSKGTARSRYSWGCKAQGGKQPIKNTVDHKGKNSIMGQSVCPLFCKQMLRKLPLASQATRATDNHTVQFNQVIMCAFLNF